MRDGRGTTPLQGMGGVGTLIGDGRGGRGRNTYRGWEGWEGHPIGMRGVGVAPYRGGEGLSTTGDVCPTLTPTETELLL